MLLLFEFCYQNEFIKSGYKSGKNISKRKQQLNQILLRLKIRFTHCFFFKKPADKDVKLLVLKKKYYFIF